MVRSNIEANSLPSEHSWRAYGPFYKNTFQLMKEIPYFDTNMLSNLSVPIEFYQLFDEERGYKLKLNIKDKAIFIEHIKGYVDLGEITIIIAVGCKHRDQAYVLSRYIIEEIKKRSPIWKKEHYENEDSEWLKGNPIQTN